MDRLNTFLGFREVEIVPGVMFPVIKGQNLFAFLETLGITVI